MDENISRLECVKQAVAYLGYDEEDKSGDKVMALAARMAEFVIGSQPDEGDGE